MKYIDYSVNTGAVNMQIDSDLLETAILNNLTEPILRLYGWNPACLSLGRNQDNSFINHALLKELGVDIVRRLTGGRALLHNNELTYCYITPSYLIKNGNNVTDSYIYISNLLIEIFKSLNISLTIGGCPRHIPKNNYCMSVSTGADLCWSNRKFIGSAQCRKNGYILQHGSILIDYNKELLDDIFQENTDYSQIVTLKEINPDLSINDIINATKYFLQTHF